MATRGLYRSRGWRPGVGWLGILLLQLLWAAPAHTHLPTPRSTGAAAAFVIGSNSQGPQRRFRSSITATAAAQGADGSRSSSTSPTPPPKPSLFVFGLGYVGARVAQDMAARGWAVAGTSTTARRESARGDAVARFQFDPTVPVLLDDRGRQALEAATHVLVSIPPLAPPAGEGDPVLACYARELAERCPALRWVGYLSSTSVYGDRGGASVTEASPPAPGTAKGRARVAAEEGWRALVDERERHHEGGGGSLRLRIFRLAGIYGPGRSAIDTLLASRREGAGGRSLTRMDGDRLVSRVHVEDIVRVLGCSMLRAAAGEEEGERARVYNVADERPASRLEVFGFAARLMGLGTEVLEEGEATGGSSSTSSARRRRLPESKRVDGRRAREELLAGCGGLRYPDYEAGLTEIWRGMQAAAEAEGEGGDQGI